MNKNTEKALEAAVKKLVKALEKTTDFALEHAPDVLKEMITEVKIKAAFSISVSFVMFVVCTVLMYALIPKAFEGQYGNMGAGLVSMFAGFGALGCVVISVFSIQTLTLLKKCPKLFLLKQLKELASSSNQE